MINNEALKQKIYDDAISGKLNKRTSFFANKYFKMLKEEQKKYYYKKQSVSEILNDDIPFQIPQNWIWEKIGNLEEINLGFTYKPEYSNKGVIFLSVKDISSGKIDFSRVQHVSQEVYDNAAYGCKPKKGDILFGRIGTIGVPYIVDTDEKMCIFVSLGFFRDYTNLINKKYICYWMNSSLFKNQVKQNVKGAAQINLNTNWLKDFLIPLPSLEEQNTIENKVEELLELLDKKEKNDQEKEKLKGILKEKILDSAIHGNLIENDLNLKSVDEEETTDEVPFEIPFEIPSNWKWVLLKNISDYGNNKKKNGKDIKDDEWILELEDIEKDTGKILKIVKQKERKAVSDKNIFKENDVLYGKLRPYLNKCVIVNKSGYCSTEIEPITLIESVIPKYLHIVLTSKYFLNYVNSCSYGAKMPRLGTKDGQNALIPVPPLEEQKKIVKKIESLFELIEQL